MKKSEFGSFVRNQNVCCCRSCWCFEFYVLFFINVEMIDIDDDEEEEDDYDGAKKKKKKRKKQG